jgi:hypothetical protein
MADTPSLDYCFEIMGLAENGLQKPDDKGVRGQNPAVKGVTGQGCPAHCFGREIGCLYEAIIG